MTNGKGHSLKVKDFYKSAKDILKLNPMLGRVGLLRKINTRASDKGISPVQVWGQREIQDFKNLPYKKRRAYFSERIKNKTVCVILSDGLSFLSEIEDEARKNKIALFGTELSQRKCRRMIKDFFASFDPNQVTISGGLLRVSGLGVLIKGDSGVGKSESALELISRGHRFISDDVIMVKKNRQGRLIGKAPSLTRHFMEIRGLGIINIKEIFGEKAICQKSEIDLVILLKRWERWKDYDRLGLEFPDDFIILGEAIAQINIPVAPGRNIATLIEVACKIHTLREKGYLAPQELNKKLSRVLSLR